MTAVEFHGWGSPGGFAPAGLLEHADPVDGVTTAYECERWTSPVHVPGFAATELVVSWNAITPPGTWIEVELRGPDTPWYVMGRWASGDDDIHRTSVPCQRGAAGRVDVDTFRAAPGAGLPAYQLRIGLYRRTDAARRAQLQMVGAMASALPDDPEPRPAPARPARPVELPVPRYSQDIHRGEYPEYGKGGEAWCSPTSTQMVIEYWGRGPSPEDLAWVDPSLPDPQVAHAARMTYDYGYRGTGNWSFNVAYAAQYGLRAHVTRLDSLAALERLLLHGVPVITSQAFRRDEVDGAGYDTDGHLMVVVGLTADGDVIANDPAAPTNEAVRRVYDRRQFETAWLRGSGGVVYLIRP